MVGMLQKTEGMLGGILLEHWSGSIQYFGLQIVGIDGSIMKFLRRTLDHKIWNTEDKRQSLNPAY